jgi:hypothetical protein
MKTIQSISILGFILLSQNILAQTKPKSKTPKPIHDKVYIGGIGTSLLFTDKSNIIVVALEPGSGTGVTTTDSQPTYSLTSSQGTVSLYDKNIFLIDNLKRGKTILKAYKVVDTGKVFIASKTFYADTSQEQKELNAHDLNPGINLAGYFGNKNSYRIPINVIKKIDKLSINDGYQLLDATVYISAAGGDVEQTQLHGLFFGEDLKKTWARLSPGLIITFDGIHFTKDNGKPYDYVGMSFVVTDSTAEGNPTPPPKSQ